MREIEREREKKNLKHQEINRENLKKKNILRATDWERPQRERDERVLREGGRVNWTIIKQLKNWKRPPDPAFEPCLQCFWSLFPLFSGKAKTLMDMEAFLPSLGRIMSRHVADTRMFLSSAIATSIAWYAKYHCWCAPQLLPCRSICTLKTPIRCYLFCRASRQKLSQMLRT